ncbi:DUF167 family protein [Rubellimicrobium roseum]|uniref:UPF0235 protein FHG71_02560 n=1 Tax=Rubellimicrobium roseum TaxID=687525 RepID=A0A5C4NJG9_9RHOB|nr:DUF167 family protein [Rubellimicrobium roseum]TNC74100.1 hypothetical protein FHG71_02560 [Rubellimicrobium roseum]
MMARNCISTGLRLRVRVTPNASADRIDGPETLSDGTTVLRLRVRAVPENGKANAAVIALLAKHLGVPKSAITLVAGDTARLKTLHIDGDPAHLAAKLS